MEESKTLKRKYPSKPSPPHSEENLKDIISQSKLLFEKYWNEPKDWEALETKFLEYYKLEIEEQNAYLPVYLGSQYEDYLFKFLRSEKATLESEDAFRNCLSKLPESEIQKLDYWIQTVSKDFEKWKTFQRGVFEQGIALEEILTHCSNLGVCLPDLFDLEKCISVIRKHSPDFVSCFQKSNFLNCIQYTYESRFEFDFDNPRFDMNEYFKQTRTPIQDYQNYGYWSMNSRLRNQPDSFAPINEIIKHSGSFRKPFTVYRGLMENQFLFDETGNVKSKFENHGYMSTSIISHIAWHKVDVCLMVIQVPEDCPAIPMPCLEHEILFPHKTTLEFVKREKKKFYTPAGQTKIHLKDLDDKNESKIQKFLKEREHEVDMFYYKVVKYPF